jgi:hypothetical protein
MKNAIKFLEIINFIGASPAFALDNDSLIIAKVNILSPSLRANASKF